MLNSAEMTPSILIGIKLPVIQSIRFAFDVQNMILADAQCVFPETRK